MNLLFTLIQKHYLSIYFPPTHANKHDKKTICRVVIDTNNKIIWRGTEC